MFKYSKLLCFGLCLFLSHLESKAQNTDSLAAIAKANEVIEACLEANGGMAYLDSLFQNRYFQDRETIYWKVKLGLLQKLVNPSISISEGYEQRTGEFRYKVTTFPEGKVEYHGLNKMNSWVVDEKEGLKILDTDLLFNGMWRFINEHSCFDWPLNFHESCREYTITYSRTDTENGRTFDVLMANSEFPREYWFDQSTHLLYKTVNIGGSGLNFYDEDYRLVDKLWFSFRSRTIKPDGQLVRETVYDTIAFPRYLPDSLFQLPKQYQQH